MEFAETIAEAYARQVPQSLNAGAVPDGLLTPCIESLRAMGGFNQGPVMTVKRRDGSHMIFSIRRVAWLMMRGQPQERRLLRLDSMCGNPRCIIPQHHSEHVVPPKPPKKPLSDMDWAEVRAIQRREGAKASKKHWQRMIETGERVKKADLAAEIADLAVVCGSKRNAARWITETTGVAIPAEALKPPRLNHSGARTVAAVVASAIRITHAELVGNGSVEPVLPNLRPPAARQRTRRDLGMGAICKNGHLLDVVGAYYDARGYANCVGCRRMHNNKLKERRKSAAA